MKALQCFVLLVYFCHVASASSDPFHVYIQRGKPGEIPNPYLSGNSVHLEQITSVYWYKGGSLLASNFEGIVKLRPNPKYNISETLSLIVNNVSDTDEGPFRCEVVKNEQLQPSISVNATIFVSPSEPAPWIDECDTPKDIKDSCTVQLPSAETTYNLTCHVTGARPAVDLQLRRVHAHGSSEAIQQVVHRVQRGNIPQNSSAVGRALFSSTLFYSGPFHENTTLVCMATGLAMGSNNGSAIQVRIWKPHSDIHASSTAQAIKTDVKIKGTGWPVSERLGIAAFCVLCVAALLLVAFVLKKKKCRGRMEQLLQAMPNELLPFLSKGPSAEDRLANELKTHYKNKMGTEYISILPGLSSVTYRRERGSIEGDYLNVPDEESQQFVDELIKKLITDRHVAVVTGSGTNCLSRRVAYDFAGGKRDSVFKSVILLGREEIRNSTGVLDATLRLLPAETQITKQCLHNVIENHRKEVLFVVDGAFLLEALSDGTSMVASKDDICFRDLLSVKGLIQYTVLVTASLNQLEQLRRYDSEYVIVEERSEYG